MVCARTYTNDYIHATHVGVYVHAVAQVNVIAEKATSKVNQTCWSGHVHWKLYVRMCGVALRDTI